MEKRKENFAQLFPISTSSDSATMTNPKVAIVYDRVNKFGGAEQVLMALHKVFPQAPLFTSVFDPQGAAWVKDWKVRVSFLQRFPFALRHHEWFGWIMPLVFESFDFSEYDIVISVTSEAAKGILTRPHQLHICYCLTPTRYLWSHTTSYAVGFFRPVKQAVFAWLRGWDFLAAQRPDVMIPISQRVAARIRKYYRRECAPIIYPSVCQKPVSVTQEKRDFFLVVSRLVAYKHVDIAIQACYKASVPLVIVGTGNDVARLKRLARGMPTVQFVGFVPDKRLASYYSRAIALLCPQEEDFGIVACEAQTYGTPVLTYAQSGVVETIVDGVSGMRIATQDPDAWSEALGRCLCKRWDYARIQRDAARFSIEKFCAEWKKRVESAMV